MDPIATELARRWGFESDEELPGGHCSRVYANPTQVLKVPFQGEERASGWRMAVAMSGTIGPVVIESDADSGALLMERVVPGTSLAEAGLSEDECFRLVLGFANKIAALPTEGLLPLNNFVDESNPLASELLHSSRIHVSLHGDLHHSNILLGPSGYAVIDPKGLVGDPAFEPSAFIRNPSDRIGEVENLDALLDGRIKKFATEMKLDPWRIWGWSLLALGSGVQEPPWDRVEASLRNLGEQHYVGH